MMVNGRANMAPQPSTDAVEQLMLRYRAAAAAARVYLGAGFSVIYQDIILGETLKEVLAYHSRPLYVVVLCPTAEAVERREVGRAKRGYGSFSVDQLDNVLLEETPRLGLWLDTSSLSVGETVDRIMSDLEAAKVEQLRGGSPPNKGLQQTTDSWRAPRPLLRFSELHSLFERSPYEGNNG